MPDHSTFSKNRDGRFRQSDAFRHVFGTVLRRCMKEGLVAGEGFAIDASVIKADASRALRWTEGEAPIRAVREYLEALDAANPAAEDEPSEGPPATPPRHISPTDPEARWTAAPGGPAFCAYSTNYLIDLEAGIIVDVEATPANKTDEVESTRTTINRVERLVQLKPKRLLGDTAYGAAPLLNWIVNEKRSEPHIQVREKANRDDGTFSRPDFTFAAQEQNVHLPGGARSSGPPGEPPLPTRFCSGQQLATAAAAR